MNGNRFSILFMIAATAVLIACSDTDTTVEPRNQQAAITIQGTLDIRNGMDIPESARLCALWNVDGNGDHTYLYGIGSIDRQSGTFTLSLDTPPSAALSTAPGGLPPVGVAWIVLADFPDTRPHVLEKGEVKKVYGAISNTAVIYIAGDPSSFASHTTLHWLTPFSSGFDIGEGEEGSGTYDIFVPSAATSFVLTISANAQDYRFPNWK
jgi:hypothetical protein